MWRGILESAIFKVFISFLFGILLGLFLAYLIFNHKQVTEIMYNWQQLTGSLIGAATPLTLFLLSEIFQQKRRSKEYLLLLQKNIVMAINNLAGIDQMLHSFLETSLMRVRERVAEDEKAGRYSVGQAFIPLSYTFTFEREVLKETTSSSYLENLVLDMASTSEEVPLLLKDISRQFDRTLALSTRIGLMKVNSPSEHNRVLLENLKEFQNFLEIQTFGVNFPIYLRKLVQTLTALKTMSKLGLRKWKRTFNFPPPFSLETSQKMTEFFEAETNKQITELQKDFKSRLLLVGENPPSRNHL